MEPIIEHVVIVVKPIMDLVGESVLDIVAQSQLHPNHDNVSVEHEYSIIKKYF